MLLLLRRRFGSLLSLTFPPQFPTRWPFSRPSTASGVYPPHMILNFVIFFTTQRIQRFRLQIYNLATKLATQAKQENIVGGYTRHILYLPKHFMFRKPVLQIESVPSSPLSRYFAARSWNSLFVGNNVIRKFCAPTDASAEERVVGLARVPAIVPR